MSKLFQLNRKDFLKGLIMAVLVPAVLIIQQSLDSGTLIFNWKAILMASISGAFAYLIKNFLTTDSLELNKTPINTDIYEYTQTQLNAIAECENILAQVGLELVGTRPKDR